MCDLVKRIVKAGEDIKQIKVAQSIGESNARIIKVYEKNDAIDVTGTWLSNDYFVIFETDPNKFPMIQIEGNVFRNGVPLRAELGANLLNPPFYWVSSGYRQEDYELLKQWGYDMNTGKYAFALIHIDGDSSSARYTVNLTVKSTHSGKVIIR